MKRYSNAKAKRVVGNHNKQATEVDEEAEIETLLQRRVSEAPESGSQIQRYLFFLTFYNLLETDLLIKLQ